MAKRTEQRVVVLGGGIAGLTAAVELRRRDRTLRVQVVEARERLGGRVWTDSDPLTGEPLELGAEFVHGRPPRLLRALRAAGLSLEAGDEEPPGDPEGEDESPFTLLPRVLGSELSRSRDRSVKQALLESGLAAHQREMLLGYVQGFYLAPPAQSSAKAIARMEQYAASIDGERAGQLRRGYQSWVSWLARHLEPHALRLGTIAERIDWRPGRVVVNARSLAGAKLEPITAEGAVIAVPAPALAGAARRPGTLQFKPVLADKRRAARALRLGAATKVLLRFARPLQVESFFFAYGSAVPVWWTPVGADTAWIVGWAGGAAAEALDRQSDATVLRAALASVAIGSGVRRARLERELTGYRVIRWSREPFIGGAYAVVPVGADGAMAELARPAASTLFFAGEATQPDQAGTVHGAYESGLRAAGEWFASRS